MAISFTKWLRGRFGEKDRTIRVSIENEMLELANNIHLRELAFYTCVNKVGNLFNVCEFRTYLDRKEIQGDEWYLWNVSPNKNQNASAFKLKWLYHLYRRNEALVVEHDGQLFVADAYIKNDNSPKENTYEQIQINDVTLTGTFKESEVLFYTYNNANIKRLLNNLYDDYQKLAQLANKSYAASRGRKGILNIDATAEGDEDFEKNLTQLLNDDFKTFFNSSNAVLPLYEGYDYKELENKAYSNESTRDIKALYDDIYDFTARSFGIPESIAKGNVQDNSKAIDELLTFVLGSLTKTISEETNRKRYGMEGMNGGSYIQINTKVIKHIDLLSVGSSIDKIISSGCFCVNDIRKACGEPIIDEPWAWAFFMTKNYANIEEILNTMKGGEEKDETKNDENSLGS